MQSNVAQERRRQLSLTQERLKELLHYDLGMYATRKEAAAAYRGAALLRGEFAKQRRRGK